MEIHFFQEEIHLQKRDPSKMVSERIPYIIGYDFIPYINSKQRGAQGSGHCSDQVTKGPTVCV